MYFSHFSLLMYHFPFSSSLFKWVQLIESRSHPPPSKLLGIFLQDQPFYRRTRLPTLTPKCYSTRIL